MTETKEKPKLKIKDYEFNLEDKDTALVLAIQDLTNQIKDLTKMIWRASNKR